MFYVADVFKLVLMRLLLSLSYLDWMDVIDSLCFDYSVSCLLEQIALASSS
jgi:hypothetical protein